MVTIVISYVFATYHLFLRCVKGYHLRVKGINFCCCQTFRFVLSDSCLRSRRRRNNV